MKVYIKNMVCQGTKLFVLNELKSLGIIFRSFEMGEIDLEEDLSLVEIKELDNSLQKYGLEIIFTNSKLVTRIQKAILDLVENKITIDTSLSYYISEKVGYNYTYLNEYYRKETGLPIEEYYREKTNKKEKLHEETWAEGFNHLKKSA
ncbi:MAG: hypothetical protein WCD55_09620 [Bacteroidales bacterium]